MIGISDIKGISIFHKTLGEGHVADLKKDLLYIQFGDQVKGFKLPLALEGIQAPLKSDNILIKLLLYDDFTCWDEGCYVGVVGPDVIKQLRTCN